MKRKFFYLIATAVLIALIPLSCHRNTIDVPVESISLDLATAELNVNGTLALVVTIVPDDAFNQYIKWKSTNTAVATVNEDGLVTAKSVGETTIIATSEDGGFTATCVVTVIKPVAGITISPKPLSLMIGTEKVLTATISPTDASNKNVKWSSNNNAVATVNDKGVVTAVTVGTTKIKAATAQDESVYDECDVTVTAIPVIVVTLDKYYVEMNTTDNKTMTLIPTVFPDDVADKTVKWESSRSDWATVVRNSNNTGTVTILPAAAGETVYISAISNADNSQRATCEIYVAAPDVLVNEIYVTPTILSFTLGSDADPKKLTPTFSPANPTNKTVYWVSSDDAVAGVIRNADNTAIVTPKSVGTATIIATSADGGKTAICNVTVNALIIPVTDVALPGTLAFTGSETKSLSVTFTPTNATNKKVKWESIDDTVATVPDGFVDQQTISITPLKAGTTTIKVTTEDGAKIKNCVVTVTDVPVADVTIELDEDELEFEDGDDPIKLNATVGPPNLFNKNVTWSFVSVPATGVIHVNPTTGTVTPLGVGTATITATTVYGSKTATCDVEVIP